MTALVSRPFGGAMMYCLDIIAGRLVTRLLEVRSGVWTWWRWKK